MKLPAFAIKNYQFVIILVFLAVLLGINSYMTMPRSEDPALNLPIYTVVGVYPGASPEDVEELIADPVEEAINELEDIDLIKTQIEEGLVKMRVEASFGVDIEDKFDELGALLVQLKPDLPEGIFSLEVVKFSPLDVVITQLALVSQGADWPEMIHQAEDIEDVLQDIPGIRSVELDAMPEEEIRIALDFQEMAARNIPLNQVVGILRGNNANIPAGDVVAGNRTWNISSSGSYQDLQEIRNTVVASVEGRIVRLSDIAKVSMGKEDDRWIGRFNGLPALFISLTQKEGNNIISITDEVWETVNGLREKLPATMSLQYAFVQAPAVEARVNDFFMNLLQGILLVGAVIFIFFGFRPSLVIMTVIPLSILMAVGALDFASFGLQQISIAGLVIALGLLVDNGIVVLENIIRYRNEGMSIRNAAVKGTSEVGIAIISSTATTLLAFFPLTQLGGGTGEFLKSLPVIVIFALIASLLLALTLTPLLSGRFLGKAKTGTKTWMVRRIEGFNKRAYLPALDFSLRRPWVIFSVAILGLVGSFMLFPQVGVTFFPTADKGLLLIEVETPDGSSLGNTQKAVAFVESILEEEKFVQSFTSNIGHGNPQVYYNRIPENYKKNHGQVMATMENWNPERFYPLLGRLRKKIANYAGAKISFSELKNGPPFEAPIEVRVVGQNLDSLKKLSFEVENLLAGIEGTTNIENPFALPKTGIEVAINRDKAGMLGVQLADIDLSIRTALTGLPVDQVSLEDGREYNMTLRLPIEENPDLSLLNQVYIASRSGAQVPLRQLASLNFKNSPARIDHIDLQRTATVSADVFDPDATTALTESIIAELKNMDFPEGYGYQIGGEYETQQDSFGNLGFSLGLALLGIFAVLVLQFRSLVQPLIVFSAIPFAFTGSILFLYLTGWSFSFFAFVGFTSLVGIVVNNSIILVDFTNQLMREGISKTEAIRQACQTRLTPILLTSLTTILGLLPLTLSQSGLWSPLGWTIIGGMAISSLLVLLIVPILYNWLTPSLKPLAD